MKRLFISFLSLVFANSSFGFGIDLHAHLFMNEGVNGIYFGKFFSDKILAKKWNHAKRSQVNEEILRKTDLDIVVVALYAAPILAGESVYKSIHKQIDQAELFIKRNPNWIIAKSSREASEALKNKKKVLILSIEGAEGAVNSTTQIKELYERGVRIITLLHLTPDRIGSPAFLDPMASVFTLPGQTVFCRDRDEFGHKINCKGLTSHGREVARNLMDAGIWIDLSHASDKAMEELISMHEKRNLPLLFTHASLRSKLHQERGIQEKTLLLVKKLGGVFGLVPSKKLLGKTDECEGTVDAFKEHYDELYQFLNKSQIALGSDTNGMIDHLKPRNLKEKCNQRRDYSEFDKNGGWWNFSHTTPLWRELKRLDQTIAEKNEILENFMFEWARIEKSKALNF